MNDETNTESTSRCLSDFLLDQYLAAELAPDARAQTEAHIDGCARCRERVDQIEAETAAFLAHAPSLRAHAAFVAESKAAERVIRRNRTLVVASSTLAMAAMVSLAVFTQRADEQTRLKGSDHVDFFLKRGEHVSKGASNEVVHPGDQLRFAYTSRDDAHFALINVDAKRTTVYFPSSGDASAPITQGAKKVLDFGVELDEQLGTERVYAVFCPAPFKLQDAVASLSGPQPVPPKGCHMDVITLKKEPAP